jgi:hypothetical protein
MVRYTGSQRYDGPGELDAHDLGASCWGRVMPFALQNVHAVQAKRLDLRKTRRVRVSYVRQERRRVDDPR